MEARREKTAKLSVKIEFDRVASFLYPHQEWDIPEWIAQFFNRRGFFLDLLSPFGLFFYPFGNVGLDESVIIILKGFDQFVDIRLGHAKIFQQHPAGTSVLSM